MESVRLHASCLASQIAPAPNRLCLAQALATSVKLRTIPHPLGYSNWLQYASERASTSSPSFTCTRSELANHQSGRPGDVVRCSLAGCVSLGELCNK